ncbi:alpha/beta hydrolase [Rugamonas sp. CCM 8940]|uniref:alpha/beta hydrolase n=1 Tax=Rugamonas sp. CCM 8940 TaxID=2765359 RepID=UPI0018F7C885|nr:alpha/beta hydrolase [Rugamonas sp. CCM 8940]MBJ7313649.1 alpha/beta hydrolase [Rugamonas sp. CCM 8940]
MSLDPHIAAWLNQPAGGPAPATLAEIRAATESGLRAQHGPLQEVAWVKDFNAPGHGQHPVRVRAYAPAGADETPDTAETAALPAIVFAHGGGWCLGSLELYDNPCRALANATGCVVLSVDYRLAPEHKFPVPLEDFYGALCWISAHAELLGLDRERIAVGGDSAGGNLAAAAALLARDRNGPPLAHQLLIYPALEADFSTASYKEFAQGYSLTRDIMQFCWSAYLRDDADADADANADADVDADAASPYAAPLRAVSLAGLPPATVLVSEYDPLRDEGESYARRLRLDGVEVRCERLDGMVHACIHMLGVTPKARQLFDRAGAALRTALAIA